jgi:hypothetical protein
MQAKTTTAPLERVKILFQVATMHYPFTGVWSTLKRIVEREGYRGLYRGNVSSLVRIFPYAATQFAAFDIFKAALTPAGSSISGAANFLAGAGAGATAVALTYPLDVIRARLAVQVSLAHTLSIHSLRPHNTKERGGEEGEGVDTDACTHAATAPVIGGQLLSPLRGHHPVTD